MRAEPVEMALWLTCAAGEPAMRRGRGLPGGGGGRRRGSFGPERPFPRSWGLAGALGAPGARTIGTGNDRTGGHMGNRALHLVLQML